MSSRLDEPANLKVALDEPGSMAITDAEGNTPRVNDKNFAVEKLRCSEDRLKQMLDSVRDYAIYQLDLEGRLVSWSAGAELIKGYAAEQIIGRHFSCFYTPEDRAAGLPEAVLAAARRDGRTEQEGWRVRQDGSRFWADVVVTRLLDPDGKHQGYTKIVRDMTERRRMQEHLQESERRLQTFLHFNPSVIFIKDTTGRYLKVNRAFEEKFGLPERQVLGRTDAEIFPEKQAAEFRANDRLVLDGGEAREFVETAEYADGPHFSLVAKFPLRNAHGAVYALGGIATDITALRRSAEQLREQSKFITDVLDSLSAPVVVLDKNGSITAVNEPWRRFAREQVPSAPNDLVGQNYIQGWRKFGKIDKRTKGALERGLSDVLQDRATRFQQEFRLSLRDGAKWISLHATTLKGPFLGAVITHEDITTRKQTAEAVGRISAAVARRPGPGLLDRLMTDLAAATGTEIAFVGELAPGNLVKVTAICAEFSELVGKIYELEGTPAANVLAKGLCRYERDVQSVFPRDRMLAELGIEGYAGAPLFDADKRPLGLICILSRRPLANREMDSSMLRIVATRTAGEIERSRVDEELRRMAGTILRLQDFERRALGRELHDTTAQGLAALEINLAALSKQRHRLTAPARRALVDAIELANQCTSEIRALAYSLRPPLLDELGLVAALRVLVQGFARRSGIRCQFRAPRGEVMAGIEVELALYRVVQEALANVHRHSGSATAEVKLVQKRGQLQLVIRDQGRGVVPGRRGGRVQFGLGLAGMRERIEQLAGTLELRSGPRGTTIIATLSCPAK